MEVTDFRMVIPVLWAVGTEAVDGGLVTGVPTGGVPVAVAESATEPLSRSAWVSV